MTPRELAGEFPALDPADARILLCAALGKGRTWLAIHAADSLDNDAASRFRSMAARRSAGEPLPYITGLQAFWGRDFRVTPDVLIPRPDTETLVETALARIPRAGRVLDLGTGSGCIACTLALERPDLTVSATDISEAALGVARGNARTLGARVRFLAGSWWDAVPAKETFEAVLSNPPYIDPGDGHLKNLAHEPALALTDGVDGLACIRTIATGARSRLAASGLLALEHGWDQGSAVRGILAAAGFGSVQTLTDLAGRDRVTLGLAS